MENEWKVGDWISHKTEGRWRDEDGDPRFDTVVQECVITKIDGNLASWVAKRVVSIHKMNPNVDVWGFIPSHGGFNTAVGPLSWIQKIEPRPDPPAQWIREFGEEYMVPAGISLLHGFEDTSWHNDTCPSFGAIDSEVTIWVDHPDKKKREMGGDRYGVTGGEDHHTLYIGADLEKVLTIAKAAVLKYPRKEKTDFPWLNFEHKIMNVTQYERSQAFSAQELVGIQEMLNCYKEYRAANSYEKVPIGLEGLEF